MNENYWQVDFEVRMTIIGTEQHVDVDLDVICSGSKIDVDGSTVRRKVAAIIDEHND